ncbi:response regulator transcription factor [Burkholderia gladioli]|uniref:response regulator transcription factor n=1 Tax=Burkholderia gladioli TaxID=28095 RepID=UPI003F7980DF
MKMIDKNHASMRVAVIGSDQKWIERVIEICRSLSHACHSFNREDRFRSRLRSESFDFLIIDLDCGGASVQEICGWIKSRGDLRHMLVVGFSYAVSDDEIAKALNAGVDDVIGKSVSSSFLNAKLQAVGRRNSNSIARREKYVFGRFVFSEIGLSVFDGKIHILLRRKEFDLALLLFKNINRGLSRGYISEIVWGGEINPNSRTLDTHVSFVRRKLFLTSSRGYSLRSLYGYGYVLEEIF